jgi:hypothetical protein
LVYQRIEVRLPCRGTVPLAVDVELVQMVIPPAEGCLDVLVQVCQRAVRHLDAPPDRWLDVEQGDLELVAQVALLRCRLPDLGNHALEDARMFLGEQVGDFV